MKRDSVGSRAEFAAGLAPPLPSSDATGAATPPSAERNPG
jgi:hypothetical protein